MGLGGSSSEAKKSRNHADRFKGSLKGSARFWGLGFRIRFSTEFFFYKGSIRVGL